MKKLFYYLLPAIMIFAVQSCTEDPINDIEPTLVFVSGANYITADATIPAGTIITTKVKALKGTNDLASFKTVQRKAGETTDTNVDLANYNINGAIGQNPKLILAANELSGFEYEISFPASTTGEEITYTFIVTDKSNNTASLSFKVTTLGVKTIAGAKLYNKAGPAEKGGIDLHTGNSTGTKPTDPTSATAELFDQGNRIGTTIYAGEFSASDPSKISIRFSSEGWDSLNSPQAIIDAFNTGNNLGSVYTAKSDNVYIVSNGTDYFAIKIIRIVDDASTTMFGNDYIEMDIKQKN